MPTLSNEQRIAIAVGVPVAAILLYLLFSRLRRDEFDDDDEDDVEAETVEEVASTSESTIEVKVPRSVVGAVIGKGGVNIKRIQKESGARLNFKDDEDEESPERTAIVRGEREKAKKAELLIKKVIAQQPVIIMEEVYVPKEACGRIIGRGGQSIRQMSRISGARLTVEHSSELDSHSPLRKVTLTGTAEQILHGKGLLEEKVTEEASFAARKGPEHNARYSSGPGYQQEKVPVTVQDTATKFPDGSDYVGVFVSALDDPTSFHVQLITENADSLEAMNAELTAEFFNSADTSVMNGFKTGDLCCAPFDVDSCWYRARITNIGNDNTVDVLYVDFGDKGQVHKSRLRVLKNRYRGLPHQAVHCSLANFRPKDDEWSEEAIEAFEEMTHCAQWQVLMARVMRYCGDVPCVELVDTNSPSQDVNVGDELEKKQLAVCDAGYPTEAVLKEQCAKNLELNHRLANAEEQKDEVSKDERNELEHKRSLSFQEYDLKAAKKQRADDASLATDANESSTESTVKTREDSKVPAEEKASLESAKNRVDELTPNGNTPALSATSVASNVLTEEKLSSDVNNQNTELTPDENTLQAQISNKVSNAEEKPISQVVENQVTELMPNGWEADATTPEDSRAEMEQMSQTPDPRRSSDQIDTGDVVDRGSKPQEELSPYHEPISPNNESSHLHYAKIKRNLSISTEDDALKGDSTVSGQLESLLEEKVQLGRKSAVDAESRQSAFLGVVSSEQSVDPYFLGNEVPNFKKATVDNQNVDIPKEEKEETEVFEKQAQMKSTPSVFTSSTHHAVSSQRTYVSSVSMVTKKKTKDVFVTLLSSAGEQTEAEGIDGLAIKPLTSNAMTATKAKRASTELVVNVSSSGHLGSVPGGETFTSNSDKVDTTNNGNHGNGHLNDSVIRSELNGYSSQTVTLATKRVTQLKEVTVVTTADADAEGFVTPSSSFTNLRESTDDSDSESFLSAREEVTSDTDTAAYLTAQVSGSTTSLDYQSLDTETDTVRLDNAPDTAHTPVNSDSEDERGGPTTPRPSFNRAGSDEEDTDVPAGSLSSKEIAERIGLFKSVSETELGYRADTESLTSRENLHQAGTS